MGKGRFSEKCLYSICLLYSRLIIGGGGGDLIEKFSCQILGNSRSAILVIICQVVVTSSYDNEYL